MPTRVTLCRAVPCMRLIVANADQSDDQSDIVQAVPCMRLIVANADQSDIVQGCSLYEVDCC